MGTKPRRPAQLKEGQIEAIEGDGDVAYNSELAHTAAQALVPMGRNHIEPDPQVRRRIVELVDAEGIDVLAELWVGSPATTLPGILWRGYLLREWIRRDGREVADRFERAAEILRARGEEGVVKVDATPTPGTVIQDWNSVFAGAFEGHFDELLRDSARLTDMLATIRPGWIESDEDYLATAVTRRDEALAATSREFREACTLSMRGALE